MSKHTPEPWAISAKADGNWWHIGAGNQAIAAVHAASKKRNEPYASMFEANARRIAACVNACRGLDTESLETILMLGETLLDRFELRNRVDAELTGKVDSLLSAMRRIEAYPETSQKELGIEAIKAIARVAIDKAEGDGK